MTRSDSQLGLFAKLTHSANSLHLRAQGAAQCILCQYYPHCAQSTLTFFSNTLYLALISVYPYCVLGQGARLVEGANINRSLLALGNCINALGEKGNKGMRGMRCLLLIFVFLSFVLPSIIFCSVLFCSVLLCSAL